MDGIRYGIGKDMVFWASPLGSLRTAGMANVSWGRAPVDELEIECDRVFGPTEEDRWNAFMRGEAE